jgi:beta-lactamase regulating signal transducer with metallopeptidase domain
VIILAFLAAWALRSAVVALAAAVLLKLLRVRDPSLQLAAWTAALFGSLLMPALTITLPVVSLSEVPGWRHGAAQSIASRTYAAPLQVPSSFTAVARGSSSDSQPVRWTKALLAVYCLGAAVLLLRLVVGVLLSRRLLRRSRPTGRSLPGGLPIHDSSDLSVPAALGPIRPVVVLPRDWREWDASRLEAILAHEQSHVRRHDPAMQLLSAFHRALLWFSPLSWWMHNRIVRLAEEASDDAALAATKDRASYAETLLQFMQRGMRVAHWEGVAMARYGKADERIHRILDGTTISCGLTRSRLAAILLLAAPVVFLAAAAGPAQPQVPAARSPQRDRGKVTRYLIVSGDDSMSGSWDGRDSSRIKNWRSEYGSHFAWFQQDGRDYIVTDAHTLAEFKDAMAPQLEVNRQQSEVNRHQAEVNHMQEGVNGHQADVNLAQAGVNRQQSRVNRGGAEQSQVDELQSEVNRKQAVVNAEQEKVNRQQAVVNGEQGEVNQMQTRASAEIQKALEALFDSVRKKNLAKEVR